MSDTGSSGGRETAKAEETGPLIIALRHLTGTRRGEEERFPGDRVSIGRGRNNHVTFDAEKERSVSHRHCEIRIEDGVALVYDIGSLNGTYLNGRRVRRAPLAEGDEIGLGREGPRLRFHIASGRTPAMAATPPAPRTGATAQEALTADFLKLATAERFGRYRFAIVLLCALLLGVSVAGAFVIGRLQDRISVLEKEAAARSREPGPAGPGPETSSPAPSPPRTNPEPAADQNRGGTVTLAVRVVDDAGRITFNREIGAGAVVGPGLVITTLSVLDEAEALLQRETPARNQRLLFFGVSGNDVAVAVIGVLEPERPQSLPYPELAVLQLDPEAKASLPRVLFGKSFGNRAVRTFCRGLSPQDLTVTQLLDARGEPVTGSEPPTLLRISGSVAMAGTPLFAGNDLAALSLGSVVPGVAVAAPALERFLEQAIKTAPRRPRGR